MIPCALLFSLLVASPLAAQTPAAEAPVAPTPAAPAVATPAPAVTPAATLRRGAFWTPEEGKRKLDEYAATWSDKASWEKRAAALREGVLRGAGLAKFPPRTALNPLYRGVRFHEGYTVENVGFESVGGYFVMGNLYRPATKPESGKCPAILLAHGHCTPGNVPFAVNKTGGRFSEDTQRLAAVLARMGAVVYAYDMTGVNESVQYPHNGPRTIAVQLWNSLRAVDFLVSLPDVDAANLGMTGASGGGTQTFLLAACEPRLKVSVPVVMVSAHFFGGCSCESGLPIHANPGHDTCNVEIAALHAPKPMLLVSDGKDWTQNTPAVEFPYVQKVYRALGAEAAVENVHLASEGHDYGPSKRQAAYAFLAKHLGLKTDAVPKKENALDESFATIETYETLRVFNEENPLPFDALEVPADIEAKLKAR